MIPDSREIADFFAKASLGAPEKAVGFVLWRVMHRYQRAIDRALAPLQLTHLQFTVLAMVAWLCRSGEPATQATLARHAAMLPMQISLILKPLEAKGLVARARAAADARTKRVEITAQGLTALRAAMPIAIKIQRSMFGDAGEPGGAFLSALRAIDSQPE